MNIHMYNMWFGDCFQIEDGRDNLFIDFGIRRGSPIYGRDATGKRVARKLVRDKQYDYVTNRIIKAEHKNFLLTHYHEDHYSGLMYMKNHLSHSGPIFDTLYLPDIWNVGNSRDILTILLLEDLMNNSKVGHCNLLELVKFLCRDVRHVVLLKRGERFENDKYIALWPDIGSISADAGAFADSIRGQIREGLEEIADGLLEIMRELLAEDYSIIGRERLIESVDMLGRSYYAIKVTEVPDKQRLNAFANEISIVFQNTTDGDENILFTGDIDNKNMDKIYTNRDGKIALYDKYYCLKIPHHGTDDYYYRFDDLDVRNYLIPSGTHRQKGCEISSQYKTAFNGRNTYCSNSNFCTMNPGRKLAGCTCGAHSTFIYPDEYKTIV